MRQEESLIQRACIQWFRYQFPKKIIFANANGGSRHLLEARRLKLEGVLAGVPDLFCPEPNSLFHGLFIEMKTKKGTVKPHQKQLIADLKTRNYCVEVCRSFEDFKKLIESYFSLKG